MYARMRITLRAELSNEIVWSKSTSDLTSDEKSSIEWYRWPPSNCYEAEEMYNAY